METYEKIKALKLSGKKTFRILLLVEAILLCLCVAGLFGKNKVYEYNIDAMQANFGTYDDNYMGVYVDSQSGNAGYMVEFPGIELPRGTYRVQVHYITDTDLKNSFEIAANDIGKESLRINPAFFFAGWNETNEEMWLLRDTEQLTVRVNYTGEGSLAVQGLTIQQTNAWNRICLFGMFVLFMAVNVIYAYVQYDKAYQIPVQNKTVTFLLGIIILFAGAPLALDYMWSSGDLGYHLMRVEGIRDGILSGQFPIRISPEWQQGYGYASPVFYGETVLYVAALFRLIGFSVTTSYRLFMFIVTAATVLIAYYCFKKMFGKPYIGVFCSALYSLSLYRIYKTYACGSWGECFGVMFLPLLAYGFYRVFAWDMQEKTYKRSWAPLTVGFTMLIQSHLLTCELVGFFTILLCIVMWKKVFRPRTFVVLAKTVIYSTLLSAWFLVPFFDYMLTGDFVIQHVSERTIQSRGLYPAHLFFTFFGNGGTIFFDEYGMAGTDPMGVGIVLTAGLLLFGYFLLTGRLKRSSAQENALGKITAVFGILAMIMSLSLFPWDRIQSTGQIAATLVSSIQFPNRFLTVANVCLTVVAGVVAKNVLEHGKKEWQICFFAGMVFCLILGSVYLTEDMMAKRGAVRVYNEQGMGTGYISGAEYLPYGADASLFMPHDPVCTGETRVSDYEKKALGAEAYLENKGESQEKAAFALLYYKGYRAYCAESGEELACYAGENFEVTVDIPAGFAGTVKVAFESPWYWRAGECVTLITFLAMAAITFYQRRWKLA